MTLTLVAANIGVFLLMLLFGAGLWHSSNEVQFAWGANFGPATKDGEWWRLGSALFLHFGLFHLAMNMASLLDGGRLVERMFGPLRFTLIYFVSGLGGNLLSLIVQGDRAISGGASGAIFGVYGALIAFVWQQRATMERREFLRLFWGACVFAAITIFLGFQIPGIDNGAHIGGFVVGLLAGAALVRPLASSRRNVLGRYRSRTASPAQWLAGFTVATALVLMIIGIPSPRYRWSEEVMAREEIQAFIGEDQRLARQWMRLLGEAQKSGATFDDLAGRIESEVALPYEESFEDLSEIRLSPEAPSAAALENLRRYAETRRDASRALVEGLRAHDMERVRDALEQVSRPAETAPAPKPGN